MDKFLSHAAMSFRDILVREGWPSNLAGEWSTTCLPYRIGQDTVRLYISLHQRLYSVALVDSWSVAKTELELHASRLATRRASAPSRLVAICEVYCYLRDAKKASWQTMQLIWSCGRGLYRPRWTKLSNRQAVGETRRFCVLNATLVSMLVDVNIVLSKT
jgi:hypothetical protein